MKFSVLIANYNNGNYFIDCYNSLMKQTYDNFEVIIVDDCSTDDSADVIENLISGDNRFKFYKNNSNSGTGYTKKRCADLASGDICGYLDPDDALAENAIESLVSIHLKNPKYVAVYSQLYICNSLLEVEEIFKRSKQIINNNKYFFNIENAVSHFFTFKKKFYDRIKLNPDVKKAVDQDLYLNLYEQGPFLFYKQPLYYYRVHKKGISQGANNQALLKKEYSTVLYDSIVRRKIKKIDCTIISEDVKENLYSLIEKHQLKFSYKLKTLISSFFKWI